MFAWAIIYAMVTPADAMILLAVHLPDGVALEESRVQAHSGRAAVTLVDDASLTHDQAGDGVWSGIVAVSPTGGTLRLQAMTSQGALDVAVPVAVPSSWRTRPWPLHLHLMRDHLGNRTKSTWQVTATPGSLDPPSDPHDRPWLWGFAMILGGAALIARP